MCVFAGFKVRGSGTTLTTTESPLELITCILLIRATIVPQFTNSYYYHCGYYGPRLSLFFRCGQKVLQTHAPRFMVEILQREPSIAYKVLRKRVALNGYSQGRSRWRWSAALSLLIGYRAAHLDAPDCGDDDLDMSAANGKLGNSFE